MLIIPPAPCTCQFLAYKSLTKQTFQDLLKRALWIVPMSGTTDDFPPVGSLNELPLELRELLITILVLIYNTMHL
jgi:hypothetical protein